MMNQYETVFILTPVLSAEQMKETVEKFKGILTKNNAELLNEENWGRRTLERGELGTEKIGLPH